MINFVTKNRAKNCSKGFFVFEIENMKKYIDMFQKESQIFTFFEKFILYGIESSKG